MIQAASPLLAEWTGPYGGIPPFDQIRVELFPDAFRQSMDLDRAEIARICDNPEPATFANTIAALESAGRAYGRVMSLWSVWSSTLNDKQVQAIELEWSPRFAAFHDEIVQNPRLFARIGQVYQGKEIKSLSAEQQRLVWKLHTDFVRRGAQLGPEPKAELSALNQRLAGLFTQFSQNELADEEEQHLLLASPDDLEGLPPSLVDGYAAAAQGKGLEGQWVVANTRSAMEPFLIYAARRDLREAGFRMWVSRGDDGDAHDNNAICQEILQLRIKRAKLLGYPTHAHWRLDDAMAKTPEAAMELMLKVWPAALGRAREEIAEAQALADREGGPARLEPWDLRYYGEKLRKAKYDLDDSLLKPYLQLEKLADAVRWASGRLFGLDWAEISDAPVAHPDIRVFKVTGPDGALVGLWYFDPYAREGKQSGAWMSEYRVQERFERAITAIVSNNCNFVKAGPGDPALISWDDGVTLFHEFGHALHGLASDVTYPTLSGTSVARDFVELPSQLNENWLRAPELLRRFARHYQTDEPIPDELLAKLERARSFNQGFSTVEYLASAIVDMRLHLAGDGPIDVKAFERELLAEIGMPHEMVMRHRIPHFGHVFAGDGYAAGYYSYLWAEVLDHDAFEAFVEEGGPFNPETARRYRETILKIGDTKDPGVAFRDFRGRDPEPGAYFRYKGFATAEA